MVDKKSPTDYFDKKEVIEYHCQSCEEIVEENLLADHLVHECEGSPLPLDFTKEIDNWRPAELSSDLSEDDGWTLVRIDYDVAEYKKKLNAKFLDDFLAFYVRVADGDLIDIRGCETDYYKPQITYQPMQEKYWETLLLESPAE